MSRPALSALSRPLGTASSLLLVAFALAGCENGTPPVGTDAGPQADAPPLTPQPLFGPCLDDSQCQYLGDGAICRRAVDGPPGGYCTVPCEDRTPCDAYGSYHHCLTRPGETQGYCELRCRNGLDCGRDGWTCTGELPPSGDGVCVGVCGTDAECGPGAVCNVWSGQCTDAVPTTGAETGSPCGGDAECRSDFCIEEVGADGTPSGWVHGACLSPCILPAGFNTSNYFAGDALPAATCAGNAVCLPAGNQLGMGDLGTCYPSCMTDADCRSEDGFACLRMIGSHTFSNGICVPRDCGSAGCPTGYRCVQVPDGQGGANNVCAPS